jgi:hypothetical protein
VLFVLPSDTLLPESIIKISGESDKAEGFHKCDRVPLQEYIEGMRRHVLQCC